MPVLCRSCGIRLAIANLDDNVSTYLNTGQQGRIKEEERMKLDTSRLGLRRRAVLAGVGIAALLAMAPAARAQDVSGELVIMQWQGGVEAELWQKLEAAFVAKNPGVTVK